MLIDSLASIIGRSGCLDSFWGKLDDSEDATLGVVSSARPFFIAATYSRDPKPTLVVVPGEDAAEGFARSLSAYLGEDVVLRYPERHDHPEWEQPSDPTVVAKRIEAAYSLSHSRNVCVVASARSLVRKMAPLSSGAISPIVLQAECELEDMPNAGITEYDELVRAFEYFGYENCSEVSAPGTMGVHGDTIDIFPGNLAYPVRLDFFGDELEDIRRIVPSTGQMISSERSIEVFPVNEFIYSPSNTSKAKKALGKAALTNSLLKGFLEKLEGDIRFDGVDIAVPYAYGSCAQLGSFVGPEAVVSLVEPRAIFDDMTHAYDDEASKMSGSNLNPDVFFTRGNDAFFGDGVYATYVSIMQLGIQLDDEVPIKRADVARSKDRLFGKMRNWIDGGYYCLFSVPSYRMRKDMELEFVDHSLPIFERLDSLDPHTSPLKRGVVNVVDVDVPLGMIIPKAKLAILSIEDLKGSKSQQTAKRKVDITEITFPFTQGDYVVHEKYGIAHFAGLVLRDLNGEMRDYLELDYAEDDKLFLPVDQFDKVTKYVGSEGTVPKITRLNSTDWSRAMTKARKATKKLAFDLIDVYSRRAASKGFRFEVSTPWLKEMEESFPYTETYDQMAAIADVKADMHSAHPMDRLICGDVGFGKTEVALRAAFICAQNKKQVMVLCPTTILAQQHFTNFHDRLAPFNMNVQIISRFKTAAEQKHILEDFSEGKVDVLIGTHRLLSRDVNPKDLGLVIIDEEQRFGVAHKEQFKNLREYIDILTLSATPIPRTMQMAVSGVRDMSLILTPPENRLPVKVHVGEWDPDVVSAAIRLELSRGGQVYYVSNRVRTIDDALDRVSAAAPEARVGVAHGQMSKEELEQVMEEFSSGLLDVLVATTIIESGIDNPHTNTLIIEDSQRLGLSQMYQLKGRVGRSHEQAYAYFMFPEEIPLTEDAQARLTALSEEQDLGSGMRIAMRDLEIRGAGNLVGAEQSGNMSAVGFDLFSQLLNQAVLEAREGESVAKGADSKTSSDVNINIPGKMYLPDDYISDTSERILWYRRAASMIVEDDITSLEHEMVQQHPDMPEEARGFFARERLRAFAIENGISSISVTGGKLTVEGLTLGREQLISLKRKGGRYLKDRSKLIVPAAKAGIDAKGAANEVPVQTIAFLHQLYN